SKSLQIPQAPPPTFLFLPIFNCQITDDTKGRRQNQRSKLSLEAQTSNPLIRLGFFRTKDFVASSAAALVQ
ncbi:hypothetical protein, partial [Rhizobium leguminosarum]|uniref:hypothetical protein n=1 Tax=Rhizobium leguminosarum TaxID=384 RepID=UPI001AEBC911